MEVQIDSSSASASESSSPDKLFGICQAIGEDFGFDPFYLRVAFLGGMFFSLPGMIAAYAALGIGVALTHWLFPREKSVEREMLESDAGEIVIETPVCRRELVAA